MASDKGVDIEAATGDAPPPPAAAALYPKMSESPELRWSFIRKVYAIILAQLLITASVAAVIALVRPIPRFFASIPKNPAAMGVYFLALFTPLILLWPLIRMRERHPINLVLLGLYSACTGVSIGIVAAFCGKVAVLEATGLTITVVVGLTLYTFWAAKRGYDFKIMGPFLFASLLMLIVYCTIQIICPPGRLSRTIFGCVSAIVFCFMIVYNTDNLIKRHKYNETVIAAISLYLDVVNLFMSLLSAFSLGFK